MTPQEKSKPDSNQASPVSVLLHRIQNGEAGAQNKLYELVHGQLRRMARELMTRESLDHTLQASALVNEAYLKLQQGNLVAMAESRRHLFGAATRAMQQVPIEHARSRATEKRGGNMDKHGLDIVLDRFESKHDTSFLDLDAGPG